MRDLVAPAAEARDPVECSAMNQKQRAAFHFREGGEAIIMNVPFALSAAAPKNSPKEAAGCPRCGGSEPCGIE